MPKLEISEDFSVSSDETESVGYTDSDRNEIQEIRRDSVLDTRRVNYGRIAVACALLVASVVVTVTTYTFLQAEQETNFEAAYDQFSRALRDAALERNHDLRLSLEGLARHLSAYAENTNASWPFVTLPHFEEFATDTLASSRCEIVTVFNLVEEANREAWIDYASENYEAWVKKGHLTTHGSLEHLRQTGYNPFVSELSVGTTGQFIHSPTKQNYFVSWTKSPPLPSYDMINYDMGSIYGPLLREIIKLGRETLLSTARVFSPPEFIMPKDEHDQLHSSSPGGRIDHPHTTSFSPVVERIDDPNSPVVAVVSSIVAWDATLRNTLPEGVKGLTAVISDTCNQSFTYDISGADAIYRGEGDLHDRRFNAWERIVDLSWHVNDNHEEQDMEKVHCEYKMHIYPTAEFELAYDSEIDEVFTVVVAVTFGLMATVFIAYDCLVQRRNEKLVAKAARSNAIVAELFPGDLRHRILESTDQTRLKNKISQSSRSSTNLKSFLLEKVGDDVLNFDTKPMAELFLEATIMFADIVGFTAWSSVREPSQVFALLENVYSAFDKIARHRRVFKVETVGDCYVAVVGLPEPRKDHSVVMCRFARDCLLKMTDLVRKLEVVLGPDTGDLSVRIGIHSGPVTAGVLRGERSRFQLFGDTVNTTARMESSSECGRIHLSKDTAELLKQAGKGHWVRLRENKIEAKGKGELQTYWLNLSDHQIEDAEVSSGSEKASLAARIESPPTEVTIHDENITAYNPGLSPRIQRLIHWNVDMLLRLIKQIVSRRNAARTSQQAVPSRPIDDTILRKGETVLEEVREIITLPEFDSKAAKTQLELDQIEVSDFVADQLLDYVTCIATMYRSNPFHNFDHASHVAMSVGKLMSRIVAPTGLNVGTIDDDGADVSDRGSQKQAVAATLHDHTYGITSDPLTQFACAFAALIHDVDHTGVPNTQLIKENSTIARMYKNRSVAEQNSLDLAWELLMDNRYTDLRAMIYSTEEELCRFRQLVVNSVMATDIVDKDLKELRNARWNKAFRRVDKEQPSASVSVLSPKSAKEAREDTNRKATIVIEHLIQASDVAHTMQHWHVYRKWNERLFLEMYKAYQEGRSDSDPSDFWYQGELGFFDFYILPLARKLKDCGVFGVSSDEYLNYAAKNRQEWKDRGQEIVAGMVENFTKSPAEY